MILTGISALIGAVIHLLVFRKRFGLDTYEVWANSFVNAFIAMALITISSDTFLGLEPNSFVYRVVTLVLGFGIDFVGKRIKFRK